MRLIGHIEGKIGRWGDRGRIETVEEDKILSIPDDSEPSFRKHSTVIPL